MREIRAKQRIIGTAEWYDYFSIIVEGENENTAIERVKRENPGREFKDFKFDVK